MYSDYNIEIMMIVYLLRYYCNVVVPKYIVVCLQAENSKYYDISIIKISKVTSNLVPSLPY